MKEKILKLTKGSHLIFDKKPVSQKETTDNRKQFLRVLNGAFDLGFSVSLPVIAGAFFGSYLDKRWQTEPKLTLSFVFIGLFIGIYSIINFVKKSQ